MTAGDLVEVPDAPPGEVYYVEGQHEQEEYVRAPSQGPSYTAPPIPLIEMPTTQPGQVVVTNQTPVFSGPIYNLESLENLPEPIESHQRLERIEGDESDPFAPLRYRLVTTHILPPVIVYAPQALPPPSPPPSEVRRRPRERKAWEQTLGELILDPLAPDGLAVKLLLIEARVPFIVHEVDPSRESNVMVANPQGKVPCWIDSDGSCVWEANAIMRYINDKHGLEDQFYFADQGPLKWRTDMALDWCREFLAKHIQHLLHPAVHEREDLSDVPGGHTALLKDFKVLTDYFLRETPFIGGVEPNMADYAICMQLLTLYSTRHPPPDRVRQYLHNAAEHTENWNEVTLPLREFGMLKQKELRETDAIQDKLQLEEDRRRRKEYFAQLEQEDAERRLRDEEEQRLQWEQEERRREADDRRRREEQDRRMKEEWDMRRRLLEERKRKNEGDRRAAEEELARLEAERLQRLEDERRWAEEYESRMAAFRLRKESVNSFSMRPQVGVEIKMLDDSDGKRDCIVCVERVVPDGPADRAGLQAEDIIDRWNGERLYSKTQWAEKVKNSKIGEKVTLAVYRGTESHDFVVTIIGTTKALGSIRKVHSKTQVSHNIRYEKPPSYAAAASPNRSPGSRKTSSAVSGSRGRQSITSLQDMPREINMQPARKGSQDPRRSSVSFANQQTIDSVEML